jgi:hypothetical protein
MSSVLVSIQATRDPSRLLHVYGEIAGEVQKGQTEATVELPLDNLREALTSLGGSATWRVIERMTRDTIYLAFGFGYAGAEASDTMQIVFDPDDFEKIREALSVLTIENSSELFPRVP